MSLKSIKRKINAFFNRAGLVDNVDHIRHQVYGLQNNLHRINVTASALISALQQQSDPRYQDPKRLNKYSASVCSQSGEDGMIHEIFKRIHTTDRIFVEIGVGDGTENNTSFLLSQGWTGYWIDGNGAFLEKLKMREDIQGGCIQSKVTFVTKENAQKILEGLGVPQSFDLLSLDIDQNTYYVWEALQAYNPRVVVIEYNAVVPADIDWKVNYNPDRVWDGTKNFGSSLKALENLGRRLGYSLVGCDCGGINAFFVRNDLVADHFASPFTAENHYEPVRYNSFLYQDGHPDAILDRPLSR